MPPMPRRGRRSRPTDVGPGACHALDGKRSRTRPDVRRHRFAADVRMTRRPDRLGLSPGGSQAADGPSAPAREAPFTAPAVPVRSDVIASLVTAKRRRVDPADSLMLMLQIGGDDGRDAGTAARPSPADASVQSSDGRLRACRPRSPQNARSIRQRSPDRSPSRRSVC